MTTPSNESTTPPLTVETRAALFQGFVRTLEDDGIEYCIVGAYDGYPTQIPSDVDLMIRAEDRTRFLYLLARFGKVTGAGIVQQLEHETTAGYFALAVLGNSGIPVFLHPDYCTDYRRSGRVWMRADDVLARRRRHPAGFFVPSAEDAFTYYLIKKIDKGQLSDEQGHHLAARFQEAPDACEGELMRMFSADTAQFITQSVKTETWAALRGKLAALRAELHRFSPRVSLGSKLLQGLNESRRLIKRVMRPTGLCVGVLGPDGAGKSTVIHSIQKELLPAFRRTHYQHLQPNLIKQAGSGVPVTDPHGIPPRALLGSLAKLAYFAADYLLGYRVKVNPMLARSTLVIFDRYYHDIFADPLRYRYGAPLVFAKCLAYLVPKPDLWLVLDAPPEVLQSRKSEVTFAESARQREAYAALARRLRNAVLIDASGPAEAVIARAHRAILEHLAHRTAARLNITPVVPAATPLGYEVALAAE
jgi:thymidylate kinase